MKKDISYYMALPYSIEITPVPEAEGGGYFASLPQIGKYTINGYGESIDEAIDCLNRIKKERFADYLSKGIDIPEPKPQKENFSGQFILRLPKALHCQLHYAAQREGVSLNQYTVFLLTKSLIEERTFNSYEHIVSKVNSIHLEINNLKSTWSIPSPKIFVSENADTLKQSPVEKALLKTAQQSEDYEKAA